MIQNLSIVEKYNENLKSSSPPHNVLEITNMSSLMPFFGQFYFPKQILTFIMFFGWITK